jgi:hypothetical protein
VLVRASADRIYAEKTVIRTAATFGCPVSNHHLLDDLPRPASPRIASSSSSSHTSRAAALPFLMRRRAACPFAARRARKNTAGVACARSSCSRPATRGFDARDARDDVDVDADVDADTIERASASDGTDVCHARPGGAPEKEVLGYRTDGSGWAGTGWAADLAPGGAGNARGLKRT